jgi:hypothetical protein
VNGFALKDTAVVPFAFAFLHKVKAEHSFPLEDLALKVPKAEADSDTKPAVPCF